MTNFKELRENLSTFSDNSRTLLLALLNCLKNEQKVTWDYNVNGSIAFQERLWVLSFNINFNGIGPSGVDEFNRLLAALGAFNADLVQQANDLSKGQLDVMPRFSSYFANENPSVGLGVQIAASKEDRDITINFG